MRLKLEFKLQDQELTAEYRRCMLSFFKYCLGTDTEQFYKEGVEKKFSFAVKLPQAKFYKETVFVPSKTIYLFFSSGDIGVWMKCYNAFVKNIDLDYILPINNSMKLVHVYAEREVEIKSKAILADFVSPLCVRVHNSESNSDRYYSVDNENFLDNLKECVKAQVQTVFSSALVDELSIKPINAKKTVVLHYGQYIEASIGTFAIHGDSELLMYLYQNGMSSRKSSGFGYFNVLAQGGE